MKMNKNNKKALSAGLAVAILVTGTFAWQSFSQYALNKTSGPELTVEPGGRLHDDFDGENKDIYIENYSSLEDGVDVYARIRLDEYFEYGTDADEEYASASDRYTLGGVTVVRGDILNDSIPVREDETTWDTYKYGAPIVGEADAGGTENIRVYRDLAFGGSTSYLPTFNKNVWDLTADINGTYEGNLDEFGADVPDGTGDGQIVPEYRYSDNVIYDMGDTRTQLEYTALDPEGEHANYDEDVASAEEIEHTVSKTESATVISMSDWKTAGSPVGAYWVYDTDGWAYYAKGISPQEASGLLLDNIQVITDPETNWFYAINVVAQIATAGDWGLTADENLVDNVDTGMYEDGITEDGLLVLNTASGNTAITNVNITKAGGLTLTLADLTVAYGSNLELAADVSIYKGSDTATSEKEVVWTIVLDDGLGQEKDVTSTLSETGVFTPTEAMKGDSFKITATSKLNSTKSDSIIVTVAK